MKYILYDTESAWNASNTSMNNFFGLPDSHGNERYAEISQVTNEENSNYGKYIFPVTTQGSFITVDKFNVTEMVEFDPTWSPPDAE